MKKQEPGTWCPLIQKECKGHKCAWYTQVRGHNPNTGEDMDHWGCAMAWLPVLLIENSQQQRGTGAAVESFRNEMVKGNSIAHQLMALQLEQPKDDEPPVLTYEVLDNENE